MSRPARPLVIFGGGALGGTVAKLAASRGTPVIVASRHMGEHPGWWRRYLVGSEEPLGWMPPQPDVVVAVSPGASERPDTAWNERLGRWLDRLRGLRPASILLAGPAGAGAPAVGAFDEVARQTNRAGISVLRFTALLAMDHHWAGGIAAELRAGRSPRVSLALPPTRALAAEDAARAVLSSIGAGGDRTLTGAERLAPEAVVAALGERFGGAARPSLFAPRLSASERVRLEAWSELPDSWDDDAFGPRLTLREWADRLPGPRRRRSPSSQ